jgi:hypothetical protein
VFPVTTNTGIRTLISFDSNDHKEPACYPLHCMRIGMSWEISLVQRGSGVGFVKRDGTALLRHELRYAFAGGYYIHYVPKNT